MKMTKKVCIMSSHAVDGKVNLLIAEIVADVVDGKAVLDKSETGYFFESQDNSTGETKTLKYVKQAWEAARESKKYFQKPLDTARINELTKGYLEDIQRDYSRSQTRERLEKFAEELKSLKRKYNVFLIVDSDDEYAEIKAVDSELGNELIVVG